MATRAQLSLSIAYLLLLSASPTLDSAQREKRPRDSQASNSSRLITVHTKYPENDDSDFKQDLDEWKASQRSQIGKSAQMC